MGKDGKIRKWKGDGKGKGVEGGEMGRTCCNGSRGGWMPLPFQCFVDWINRCF